MIRIISASARIGGQIFCPPTYGGGSARCGRARVSAACARQSGLRAGFLGPPSGCWGSGCRPRWATGGCPPPGADRRPGCARSGGENPKFPPRRWLRSVPRGQPMAIRPYGTVAPWHRGTVASVSLRRRCPSWNGEPTVNADGEMSEIAEVELTRHRVVASSADTVRRCFRQILAGWAIATKLCGILGRWTWTEPRFKSLHLL